MLVCYFDVSIQPCHMVIRLNEFLLDVMISGNQLEGLGVFPIGLFGKNGVQVGIEICLVICRNAQTR